jgi:4-hydroxy-tetrahydrodipicolinate reductase
MDITILGDGALGRAVDAAWRERGVVPILIGAPPDGRHDRTAIGTPVVTVEASRPAAVATNLDAALDAGCRCFVVATTGWERDREAVTRRLEAYDAAAVAASNFSLGVALFGRLVDRAVQLFGPVATFDPYLVEWHRGTKADRPSGTARDLAGRIIAGHPRLGRIADASAGATAGPDALEVCSIRAGSSPGMHLVGFDAPSETVELRLTARDRSAYAAGILAAADWLLREPRPAGLHPFDPVVDDLLDATVCRERPMHVAA